MCLFGSGSLVANASEAAAVATPLLQLDNGSASASCIAPDALITGAAALKNWSEVLADPQLAGTARILHASVVALTTMDGFQRVGSLTISPPRRQDGPSATALRVSFDLLVGRGTGGEGFSVSFAQVGSQAIADERGVGRGLVISFSSALGRLQVIFQGHVLLDRRLDGKHETVPQISSPLRPPYGADGQLC
jgi:hypothetical protein